MAEPTDPQIKLQQAKAAFLDATARCDPLQDLVQRHPIATGALALGLGLAFGRQAKKSRGGDLLSGLLQNRLSGLLTHWINQRLGR